MMSHIRFKIKLISSLKIKSSLKFLAGSELTLKQTGVNFKHIWEMS